MTEKPQHPEAEFPRNDRVLRVTGNRGKARHRVRYAESGGPLASSKNCKLCQPS